MTMMINNDDDYVLLMTQMFAGGSEYGHTRHGTAASDVGPPPSNQPIVTASTISQSRVLSRHDGTGTGVSRQQPPASLSSLSQQVSVLLKKDVFIIIACNVSCNFSAFF